MNRITRAFADTTRALFRSATVTSVTDHGPRFRSITLTGDGLTTAKWKPGDKVQVRVGDGLTTRTYTPITWDAAHASTELLVYAHDTGPGSAWSRQLQPGTSWHLLGPRSSLRLDDIAGPLVLVGDETSLAVASAWCRAYGRDRLHAAVLEVHDALECAPGLAASGISPVHVVTRRASGAHIDELFGAVVDAVQSSDAATLCLTGKAQTVAELRRRLKAAGLAGRPTRVKAYWDERRRGLD